MSRGGGWGPSGGKNDLGKMGGQALPWEYDPELEGKLNTKPSEKFPPIQPPIADAPSPFERHLVSHYRTLRARIHDGPFYAILDSSARVHKSGKRSPVTAHYDPFESMPTYSQRYTKKKNTLPKLSSRPFVKSFFPEELWAIVEPGSAGVQQQKKTLNLSTRTRLDRFEADIDEEEDGEGEDGADEDKVEGAEDEDKEEEDPDQFDEDDEDDNDDYNAEQYFDGGDDDEFGGEDGGGDGDDY
jgi:DNA-directed RNA polymerase III subunit RPC7